MRVEQLKNWSQRQQVLATILMGGALIFALWFFLLSPLNHRRQRLEQEIDRMRSQLASKNYLLGEAILRREQAAAEEAQRTLDLEWRATMEQVAAFGGEEDAMPSDYVGHIDYKVALFDVRHRLLKKSRDMKISLPHDLGIDDAVRSGEDARKLMLQLRTVEKLVDGFLDLKIDTLREIEPLTPRLYRVAPGDAPFLEEYPVRVRFSGRLENLFALCHAVLEPGNVFALQRFRVENQGKSRQDLLEITAYFGAFVFTGVSTELGPVTPERPVNRAPLGI